MGLAQSVKTIDNLFFQFDDLEYSPRYLNAYIMSLGYGGPEEGGWYFTQFEPLSSIRLSTKGDLMNAFDLFKSMYKDSYDDGIQMSSVISQGDLYFVVEDHFAEYSPKERPRYE